MGISIVKGDRMTPCSNCLFYGRVRQAEIVRHFIPPTKIKSVEKRKEHEKNTHDLWQVCSDCNTELDELFDLDFQRYYNRYIKCSILLREYDN